MEIEKRLDALEREVDNNNESSLEAYVTLGAKVQRIDDEVRLQGGMIRALISQVKKMMGASPDEREA